MTMSGVENLLQEIKFHASRAVPASWDLSGDWFASANCGM